MDLAIPDNWKELVFHLDNKDLWIIGGKKNVPRTYEALCALVGKVFTLHYKGDDGREIESKIHWIDSFYYDRTLDRYSVRVSPDIMAYLVNVNVDFTTFDAGTALKLKSKYSQRIYEMCSKFSGDFRHYDKNEQKIGNVFKKRVLRLTIEEIRELFHLNEVRDSRTGKIVSPSMYKSYGDIRKNILKVAQEELFSLYTKKESDIWFDFVEYDRYGVGMRVSTVLFFVYTRKHPKLGEQRIWRKGDAPLYPYEISETPSDYKTPNQKIESNVWYGFEGQEEIIYQILSRYLTKKETSYYITYINNVARKYKDCYTQVIQVLQEKEKQPKFSQATKQYKRNNIKNYVFQENLKVFGWSIPPPATKVKKIELRDLFSE